MTPEEKAKAYDKVREKIAVRFGTDVAEGIFSEFEESEDERIRKALIKYFKNFNSESLYTECLNEENIIAWLEKQGKVESDNDDIEAEEKSIREAFNKIEDEKQCKQKPQRMISAEAKEAMYNKPADKVEPKCDESETKIFDAPTLFEDKLYAFVAACEFLTLPAKIEFIKEHSQELLDAAKEQIEKKELKKIDARENLTLDGDLMEADCMIVEQKSWSEEDKNFMYDTLSNLTEIKDRYGEGYGNVGKCIDWVKALKQRIGG